MLQVNPNSCAAGNPSQALLAFKPRQVLLTEQSSKKTTTTTMKKKSKNHTLNPDQKAFLLRSVLKYLESSGFSRTLKRLISEAEIEDDNWKQCSLNLEDMYGNYLEARPHDDTNCESHKEQELKDVKKSKKAVDFLNQDEKNAKSLTEANVMGEPAKKQKDNKKKKSKSTSELIDANVEKGQLDSIQTVNKEQCKTDSEAETKSKDKKKKKKSSATEECNSVLEKMPEVHLEDKKRETKDKKRKKEGSVSEMSDSVAEIPGEEDPPKSKSKMGNLQCPEDALDKEKKSSKKRKRLASDENAGQPVDKLGSGESKRQKAEGLEQTMSSEQLKEINAVAGDIKSAEKGENGFDPQDELKKESVKQLMDHANGELEKNGEISAPQKSGKKQQNGSAEPKTVNAFQRVKIDKVEFADERLQDNSYWAKDGAESGYGAKAQGVLGQVRGRGFRHEKTKKKRGSYRGGQIDLSSHSVKFNYSDNE